MILSIVVPAYNEEKNIQVFYDEILKVYTEKLEEEFQLELLFIDDGSRDSTKEKIRKLITSDTRVKAILFSRNFGHQAALTAGLEHATGDITISMDCDLQDPPSVIVEMIQKWKEGNEIVYARRKKRHEGFLKKWSAIYYYKLLSSFSDIRIPRNVGDFRLMDRVVIEYLKQMPEQARYLRGMVSWLGFKYDFVDFDRPNRIHGETQYSPRKMIRLAMNGILNFSFFPLRIGFIIGAASILVAGIFFVLMAADKLVYGTEYPLFKWLTVILLGFAGLQFIFLWILGEYIGRIYDDVRHRPIFVISEKLNFENEE